jgi:hypothetical protein
MNAPNDTGRAPRAVMHSGNPQASRNEVAGEGA